MCQGCHCMTHCSSMLMTHAHCTCLALLAVAFSPCYSWGKGNCLLVGAPSAFLSPFSQAPQLLEWASEGVLGLLVGCCSLAHPALCTTSPVTSTPTCIKQQTQGYCSHGSSLKPSCCKTRTSFCSIVVLSAEAHIGTTNVDAA